MRLRVTGRLGDPAWVQRALVILTVQVACITLVFVAVARTLVPYPIDGEVARVESRSHGFGNTQINIVRIDGDTDRVADRTAARTIRGAQHIEKQAWSATLVVDGDKVTLWQSRELAQALTYVVFIAGLVAVLDRRRPLSNRPRK